LIIIISNLLTSKACAEDYFPNVSVSAEAVRPVSLEASALPSVEATSSATGESIVEYEEFTYITDEYVSTPQGIFSTSEISSILANTQYSSLEGIDYKDVPWGADFNAFKKIKNYPGNLSPDSAGFVSSSDDIIISMMLDVPVEATGKKSDKRIMFEAVPQKFSSVYYSPEDINYVFYEGKFALAYSTIIEKSFDLYRDGLYKKYNKIGSFSKQISTLGNKKYKVEGIKFEKGKTSVYLMRCSIKEKKKASVSANLLFVYSDLFNVIKQEISAKGNQAQQSIRAKNKQAIEKDLQKID
jgi:hypothetical protein